MRKRVLWTSQTKEVVSILQNEGVVKVQKKFIDRKYEESAWIFQTAYQFLSQKLEQKVARPAGAESPFWLFWDPKWAGSGANQQLLRFAIPEEELLLFDLRKWSRVLNLSFLGTPQQQQEFEQKMRRQGIKDALDIFETPFYPLLRQEIVQSWDQLLDTDGLEEVYVQAACWQLKKEWLEMPQSI